MPEKIIILTGARESGKSKTLVELQRIFTYVGQRNFYEHNGKRICIFRVSPQEERGAVFCDDARVSASVERMIAKCDSGGCTLLILPFSLRTNRRRELNSGCIERPIERLRRRFEVHVVYLRTETNRWGRALRGLAEMDTLMDRLNAERIESTRVEQAHLEEQIREQATQLRQIIDRVDP